MVGEKLLTVREVASLLGASEKEVLDLAENGEIPAYKVGGVYLRFKREQVEDFRKKNLPNREAASESNAYSFKDRISDFFYFNDFYLLSLIIIALVIFIILKD